MTGILVHEWLAPRGGSENVFEVLSDVFPDAERWCLWNDSGDRFQGVQETWLARTPLRRSKAAALPFMPAAWRSLPRRDADWVLCSSHAFAHHARFRETAGGSDIPKLVYAHTPARYVWVPETDARGSNPIARLVSAALRPLDRRRAKEPVAVAANSQYVAERIERTWEREATVIYPPVDVERFAARPRLTADEEKTVTGLPDGYVLGASRFVEYKRLDEVIRAGSLAGLPVVLAGAGPQEAQLRAMAAAVDIPVTFVIDPSQDLLAELYRRASLLVFAPVEDFGIMPVEAMAAGTPVVVNARGGAAESVVDGVTGVHVHEWGDSELRNAVERSLKTSSSDCEARAKSFDVNRFREAVRRWVEESAGLGR
jgi:glycosyltransferase involved in cell wall biosynthesis